MNIIDLDETDLRLLEALQTDAAPSNQTLAAQVHITPPTCLRRVKRLRDAGLIEGEIALLSPDKLAVTLGHGLTAIVEITLDRQGTEHLDAFEMRIKSDLFRKFCASPTHRDRGRVFNFRSIIHSFQ